jgi:hypothetical protein
MEGETTRDQILLLGQLIKDSAQVSNPYNGDNPPYSLFNPELERLMWICDKDQDGKLTSVFSFQSERALEKQVDYLTEAQAKHTRDELVKAGWKPTKPPGVQINIPELDSMTRAEKKRLKKNYARYKDKITQAEKEAEKKGESS